MEGDLTLSARQMALSRRVVEPGLVYHSDGCSQYASLEYTNLQKERNRHQHVAKGQSVGQRRLRVLYENT
jgi:hypothetical protein